MRPLLPAATLAAAMILLLPGCATMSGEECATADWRALGYQDGSRGEPEAMAGRRGDACAKHGIAMDAAAYLAGRAAGLEVYCTTDTGFALGESGRRYNGVCQGHGEAAFLAAYDRGHALYLFTTAASAAATELSSARARHDALEAELDRYWQGHRDEGLTTEEHNQKVLELWAERKYLAETAIPYWRYAQVQLDGELHAFRGKLATSVPGAASLRPMQFPGPAPYGGPTPEDAREMLREVFSTVSAGIRANSTAQ